MCIFFNITFKKGGHVHTGSASGRERFLTAALLTIAKTWREATARLLCVVLGSALFCAQAVHIKIVRNINTKHKRRLVLVFFEIVATSICSK